MGELKTERERANTFYHFSPLSSLFFLCFLNLLWNDVIALSLPSAHTSNLYPFRRTFAFRYMQNTKKKKIHTCNLRRRNTALFLVFLVPEIIIGRRDITQCHVRDGKIRVITINVTSIKRFRYDNRKSVGKMESEERNHHRYVYHCR